MVRLSLLAFQTHKDGLVGALVRYVLHRLEVANLHGRPRVQDL